MIDTPDAQEVDYAGVKIPDEIEPLVRVAVETWGQDHIRPGVDLSQGTVDLFYSCRTKTCPFFYKNDSDFGPPHRAIKVAIADNQPVAANESSIICSGCGKKMEREDAPPVAVAAPESDEVAQIQEAADRTFYTPDAYNLAEKVMAARAKQAEADAKIVPPTLPTDGEIIAGKVRAATDFSEVREDIATFLERLR